MTSGLAGLLKPIWLSLIWTKVKSAPFSTGLVLQRRKAGAHDAALHDQSTPVRPKPCT